MPQYFALLHDLINTYTHIYIYIYTERERERERKREREREREAEGELRMPLEVREGEDLRAGFEGEVETESEGGSREVKHANTGIFETMGMHNNWWAEPQC